MDKFYLNNIFIDAKRNQVCHGETCELVEPKAMALLCVFAQHPKKVLSQEFLFEQVWPNRIFAPSSLQRLIALLRKALKDDSKAAKIILTHAKRGYSLEISPEIKKVKTDKEATKTKKPRLHHTLAFICAACMLCILLAYLFIVPSQQEAQLSIVKSKALTHSTDQESRSKLSFDAEKLIFMQQKHDGFELVLKTLSNTNKYVLLKQHEPFTFAWLDNDKIIVSFKEPKSDSIKLKIYEVETSLITFRHSISLPDDVTQVDHLSTSTNGHIYFVATQQIADRTIPFLSEVTFEKQQITFLAPLPLSTRVHSLAVAPDSVFVSLTQNQTAQKIMRFSRHTYDFTSIKEGLSSIYHLAWYAPEAQLLLFDTLKPEVRAIDGKLLSNEKNNNVKLVPVQFFNTSPLTQVSLQNSKLVATIFSENIDILSNIEGAFKSNSKYEDYLASVSSDGEKIAFVSQKHGLPMLFLRQNEQDKVIFNNSLRSDFISKAIWSADNTELAFAASGKAFVYHLASNQLTTLESDAYIVRVDHWSEDKNTLITTTRQANSSLHFDLSKGSATVFNQRGTIIFSNENQQTVWDRNKVFNLQGEQVWSFNDGEIVHAFSLEQHILVHVRTGNSKNYLVALSTNLAERNKLALPPEADFVSSAYYDEKTEQFIYFYSHWLDNDADIVSSHISIN